LAVLADPFDDIGHVNMVRSARDVGRRTGWGPKAA
jgi:hypothetical protein